MAKTAKGGRHFASGTRRGRTTRPPAGAPSPFGLGGKSGKSGYIPQFFHNAYNEEDYDTFEDIWAHTPAGKAIDLRIQFAMGEGMVPTFKLRRPNRHGDEEEQKKMLAKYDNYLDDLMEIDRRKSIDIFRNTYDAAIQAKVFGRAILGLEPGGPEPVEMVKPIHPRRIGRVFVHQGDWSLSSVHIYMKIRQLTYEDEMIYFVNKKNSPRLHNMWYGYSDLQRVAGQARALRDIMEVDIPEIVRSQYSGAGIVLVDQEKLPENEKQADLDSITRALKAGQYTAITKQGEKGVEFNQFKFNADISGLIDLASTIDRSILGNAEVPGALMGREEEANMATMYGKMVAFMNGPIRVDRRWIGETLAAQWYERNLVHIAPPELLAEVEVVPEFKNFPINAWMETIDGLLKLQQLVPNLPPEEILRMAGLEHLAPVIEKQGINLDTMQQIAQETESPELSNKLKSFAGQPDKLQNGGVAGGQ